MTKLTEAAKQKLTDIIVAKLLWLVNLLPGDISINNPGEIGESIIWLGDDGVEDGKIQARVFQIVTGGEWEYALVVLFSFPDSVFQSNNSLVEPESIGVCLENYPEPHKKVTLTVRMRVENMATAPLGEEEN